MCMRSTISGSNRRDPFLEVRMSLFTILDERGGPESRRDLAGSDGSRGAYAKLNMV